MKKLFKILTVLTATLLLVTGCADSNKGKEKEKETEKEKEVEVTILDAFEDLKEEMDSDGFLLEVEGMEGYSSFEVYILSDTEYAYGFEMGGEDFYVQCNIDGKSFAMMNGAKITDDDSACDDSLISPFTLVIDQVEDIVEDFEDYDVEEEKDVFVLDYDDSYTESMDITVAKDATYFEITSDDITEFTTLRVSIGFELPY